MTSDSEDDQFLDEYLQSDDEPGDDKKYAELAAGVAQLDNIRRIKPAVRKEVSSQISEFHIKGSKKKSEVHANDLVNVLGGKSKFSKIDKTIKRVSKKSATLPKPLEKPVAEKIKRKVGFEVVKNQLKKWDAVVARNRATDHLIFPLNEPKFSLQENNEFFKRFVTMTPLEKEIYEVENGTLPAKAEEDVDEFPLTLEEMIQRRKELAHIRARQSYKEAKAYRQSKIKSKKYHRLLKREKIRKEMKEFETLQKVNPEAALKKLEELERTRAEERANLRHRNTGKWAKNLAVRAKYDKETRQVLAEQLSISRDLTSKACQDDSSDEDTSGPNPGVLKAALDIAESNPWSLEVSSEVNEFISGLKNYWGDKNKMFESNAQQIQKPTVEDNNKEVRKTAESFAEKKEKLKTGASTKWMVSDVLKDSRPLKRKVAELDLDEAFYIADKTLVEKVSKKFKSLQGKVKPLDIEPRKKATREPTNFDKLTMKKSRWHVERVELDEEIGDVTKDPELLNSSSKLPIIRQGNDNSFVTKSGTVNIDPDNFLKVKPKILKTPLPDDVSDGDEVLDEVERENQHQVIMEAFADDNVVDEFKEMKETANKEAEPEVVTELPGWGSWGGAGTNATKRKKRRFLQMPALPARKDKNLPDVIINEEANPKIKDHMVKEVPFPFRSVDAFEANIRAPVSREWIPEKSHRSLIRPQVVTRQGTVIEPISDAVMLRNQPALKSLFKGKKKTR